MSVRRTGNSRQMLSGQAGGFRAEESEPPGRRSANGGTTPKSRSSGAFMPESPGGPRRGGSSPGARTSTTRPARGGLRESSTAQSGRTGVRVRTPLAVSGSRFSVSPSSWSLRRLSDACGRSGGSYKLRRRPRRRRRIPRRLKAARFARIPDVYPPLPEVRPGRLTVSGGLPGSDGSPAFPFCAGHFPSGALR